MTQFQGQEVVAFSMVAVAAVVVGRRMVGQIAAFRGPKSGSGCGGCGPSGPPKPATPKLVQIQTRPPMHIRRPDGDS